MSSVSDAGDSRPCGPRSHGEHEGLDSRKLHASGDRMPLVAREAAVHVVGGGPSVFGGLWAGLVMGLFVCISTPGSSRADDMRPAYLGIQEYKSGAVQVVWKVPVNQKLPTRFGPVFPESFQAVPPKERVPTSTAVVETWTVITDGQGLRGATIGVEGLDETAMDTLVRIQFADGSLHRVVLRPTEAAFTVPDGSVEATGQQERGAIMGPEGRPVAIPATASRGLASQRGGACPTAGDPSLHGGVDRGEPLRACARRGLDP